jgi:gamma-glutamyltranspeptidase/glutathione hydrolase
MASAAGARVLREGGNAIDAAVATSFALAVTFPQAGNLGGGGFLLYAPATESGGAPQFLDYRETAPRNVRAELFLSGGVRDELRSTRGALPVGVPGTVAGLAEALQRFGTLPWERVLAPAIELAQRGVWLTTRQARYLDLHAPIFREFPSSAAVFLGGPGGAAPLPGTVFVQPSLAATLERLARQGPREFYEGETAHHIAATMRAHGGVLDEEDLRGYRVAWRRPFERSFLGRRVLAPSLPSGGGLVLLAGLGLFEAEGLGVTPPQSAERYVAYARVMRVAFALRGALLGDPATLPPALAQAAQQVAEQPYSHGELDRLAAELAGAPSPRLGHEQNTTHLCVIDPQGNAVSNTYSLNTIFGSKLVVEGGGFLLNNSLDDFSLKDGVPNWYELSDGRENLIEPGKRPVSSMCPTIFLRPPSQSSSPASPSLNVELVVGGSGGPRIPTLLLQIAQATLGDDYSVEEAVRMPRVHHQFKPDELVLEDAIRPATKQAVRAAAPAPQIVETPMLGIAAALRVGGPLSPGVADAQSSSASGDAPPPPLAAVLDSRFTLV